MKKIASYALDPEVLTEFNKYASENHINKSGVVQELLEQYLKAKRKS